MIRCIFCKSNSDNTKGIEHVIPESLGNIEHVLPKGAVCDSCNNYFATKIEKQLLEQPYFINVRHRNWIPSKKNRIPPDKALIFHPKGDWVDLYIEKDGLVLNIENPKIIDLISSGAAKSMILPIRPDPIKNDKIVSRFLAKTALEALAYILCDCDGWNEEIVDKLELDPLREYARYGKGDFWKYHQRRIYEEDDRFTNPVLHPEPYEVLHEMDFLYIDEQILYFAIVIMGIEYVINLGGSETEMYEKWLLKNNNKSPIKRGFEYKIERNK